MISPLQDRIVSRGPATGCAPTKPPLLVNQARLTAVEALQTLKPFTEQCQSKSEQQKSKRNKNLKEKAIAPEPKLETMLWAAADKPRGHIDAAEYKHVVLGLIFLKYISDAFDEYRENLGATGQ